MSANKITTQVFMLPDDEVARKKFLAEVNALASEYGAVWVSGSVYDEMAYADLLAEELSDHITDMAIEDIRHNFERKSREIESI
ncbi:hypothetical protein Q6A51_13300 [Pseudomonas sp. KFB-139]|uniref:Uncharacterized protein n=1 Tax=Pseudomonas serbiensis TaxID=3064350 RepID=A0ABT9CQJ3_9PSED|nr:hypothetical protein [Pseudomonas sp. KFB-138]MDO7927766.1 hypothetical protein [Pseudomonas sp. KFB-138]